MNAPRVAKLTQHVVVSGSVRCYPGGESLNAPRVAKLTQHMVVCTKFDTSQGVRTVNISENDEWYKILIKKQT